MKILDLTAGYRAIWHNKKHPLATYLDLRPEVEPDFVVDTRKIPDHVVTDFDLIVYDPPHMNCGPNGIFSKRYGHFTNETIRQTIEATAREAYRISKPGALMAFKWNDHDIKLKTALDLMNQWEPLFGHLVKNGPHSQTHWVMLRKII